jgi:hypothetical protein
MFNGLWRFPENGATPSHHVSILSVDWFKAKITGTPMFHGKIDGFL